MVLSRVLMSLAAIAAGSASDTDNCADESILLQGAHLRDAVRHGVQASAPAGLEQSPLVVASGRDCPGGYQAIMDRSECVSAAGILDSYPTFSGDRHFARGQYGCLAGSGMIFWNTVNAENPNAFKASRPRLCSLPGQQESSAGRANNVHVRAAPVAPLVVASGRDCPEGYQAIMDRSECVSAAGILDSYPTFNGNRGFRIGQYGCLAGAGRIFWNQINDDNPNVWNENRRRLCSLVEPPVTENPADEETECLVAVNKYRALAGKPALPSCGDAGYDMAYQAACYDMRNQNGVHASVDHFQSALCPTTNTWAAQNSGPTNDLPNPCSWDDVIKCQYDEVYNGRAEATRCCRPCVTCEQGHYLNLISDSHTCVSCASCENSQGYQQTVNFCR